MLDKGLRSARGATAGVDVAPLAKAAGVSREMARRYTDGKALPDLNRMQKMATWLGIRLPWLRDGEGEKHPDGAQPYVTEPDARPYLPAEAVEIAKIWLKLPPSRRQAFRDLMALEAVVSTHYPWLQFGIPKGESYKDYETRVERDILRLAAKLQKTE